MAPPRRILKQQLEILMNFLEKNREMSKGLIPGAPISRQETKQKWASLAKKLNAVDGGAMKTADEWKKYWFEWRHKCRKKARRKCQNDSAGNSTRIVPFNNLEVRALQLSGEGSNNTSVINSKMENSESDDSDSEPLENIKMQSNSDKKVESLFNSIKPDDELLQSSTPPPRWALDIEERRIAAEERMALALESIANVMRTQEERRSLLEERLADTLTNIAGTVQDLNTGFKDVVNHLQQLYTLQHSPNNTNVFI